MNKRFNSEDKIILAIDGLDLSQAKLLLEKCPNIKWVKVGLELFVREGPKVIEILKSLDKKILSKAKKLKAIINVESNFMNNVDYTYCSQKGIHVIATSPVFSKPVAEIALGMTLSLLRNIHNAHFDFVKGKEKYGLESNLKASLLSGKKIGLLGFGDLAKSLYPMLLPFTKDINVYDPWLSKNKIKSFGFNPVSLNKMFKTCEIIYVLAAVTTKNKNLVNKSLINKMKSNSLFILMSRAAVVNFKDLITRVKKEIYM